MQQLLDFIANSVRVGSRPGNGKREWLLAGIMIAVGIAVVGVIAIVAS